MELDLSGKICLVTGASSGLGNGTALLLARRGAIVVMLSRKNARGQAAWEQVRAQSPEGRVDWIPTDLASLASVRRFADAFTEKYRELNRLFHCAGVLLSRREVTEDGMERMFQVNYLSAFLLTNLLFRHLSRANESRVISVSGRGHKASLFEGPSAGTIDFTDLQGERRFSLPKAGKQSILAKILFTYEIARRWAGTPVTACAICPGLVRTELGAGLSPVIRFFFEVAARSPVARSPEQAAEFIVSLATAPDAESVNGKYYEVSLLYRRQREARSSAESYDLSVARQLWTVSERLSGL